MTDPTKNLFNSISNQRDHYKALWDQSCQMVAQIVEETGTAKDGEARDLWTLHECVVRLRAELDALKAALPKTADGTPMKVGLKIWFEHLSHHWTPMTVIAIGRDTVELYNYDEKSGVEAGTYYTDAKRSHVCRRHPITGKTPEEGQ